MRSSVLLTSALAASAFAMPHWGEHGRERQDDNRHGVRIVTETATRFVTVFVTINAAANQATRASSRNPNAATRSSKSKPTGATLPIRTGLPDARPSSKAASSRAPIRTGLQNTKPSSKAASSRTPIRTGLPDARPSSKAASSRAASASSRVAAASSRASSRAASASKAASSSSIAAAAASASAKTTPTSSKAVPTSIKSSAPASSRPTSSATPSTAPTSISCPANAAHKPGTQQAYLSSGCDYQASVLYHHNAARANHGAAPLTWDAACEANALIAAKTCNFAHYLPPGANQGQNLFTVSGEAFNVTAGITESWYKSEFPPMQPYFGNTADIPENVFHSVGHLTQVLWKATTKVGCVSIDCGANMKVNGASSMLNKYTVCNYAPPGNVGGQYKAQVGVPKSTTDLGIWTD